MKLPHKFIERAKVLLRHPARLKDLLNKAEAKQAAKSGHLQKVKSELLTMTALVKAWVTGEYRKIPWNSMLRIVGALLYFVWVIDLIPDPILGVGFIDDISVIYWTLKGLRQELKDFKEWQNQQKS